MEKLDIKKYDIDLSDIVFSITTEQDYEMSRWFFIEPIYGSNLSKKLEGKNIDYIIGEGGHCSCYDFDDTEFDFIGYTKEELKELVLKRSEQCYYQKEEKELDEFIKNYV